MFALVKKMFIILLTSIVNASNHTKYVLLSNQKCEIQPTHPATRRRSDIVTTSLCTSQRRRRYVSNETLNDVSVERLYDILMERRDVVSRGRNNKVSSLRLQDVSSKSQMKHPTTSQWYVTKTSLWYISITSH